MSRSCQRATFSCAASAFALMIRAMPQIRSQRIGLRLCGIALEPFWPRVNGSSASPMSDRWSDRISVAIFSREAATRASEARNAACRSRWMICVVTFAVARPRRRMTYRSTRWSMCVCVPTAPVILPTRTSSIAASTRSMPRPISSCQTSILRPKVTGSACMPCVRPIIGVRRCRSACRRIAVRSDRRRAAMPRPAAVIWQASAVSRRSELVMPRWR